MDNISVSWNKRYKFAKHFLRHEQSLQEDIFLSGVLGLERYLKSHPYPNQFADIFRQKLLQYCATNFQIVSSKMGTTSTTIRGNRQVKASFATYPREQENRVKICANV